MKRNQAITLVLFLALALVLLLYFIGSNSAKKRYLWYENYRANSDQPYGTMFVKKMLEGYVDHFVFNSSKSLQQLLDSVKQKQNTDYVFVGQGMYLNDRDVDALAAFIKAGNNAFIASVEFPENLINQVYESECDQPLYYEPQKTDFVTLNFYHDTLRTASGIPYHYRVGTQDLPYYWNYISQYAFCDSTKNIVPLAYQEPERVNFIKIQYGRGNLFLHTNPIVFTNYFLTKSEKVTYASGVFSHLHGKNIIWDEFSKVSHPGNNDDTSPLYYLLQQPSLKYAWWIMLVTTLLYVLFTAKRKQRVIPVLETKANTSLEFVTMISMLHFQNGDHLDIARKKMKYFLYYIRAKYGVHTQNFQPEHVRKLAEKSKVRVEEVQNIFDQYDVIERHAQYNTSADKLVGLYYAIENFYKNCK